MPNKSFSEILTFSRASEGTYFDADGVLQTAGVDEERLTHDPVTGEPQGLLVEEERTNVLLDNRDLSTGSWGGSAIIAKDATGLDGAANTAHTITNDESTSENTKYQEISVNDDTLTHTWALNIAKDDDESRFPEINLTLSGGASLTERIRLNTKTGEANETNADGGFKVVDFGEFWGVILSLTNNGTGNTNLRAHALRLIYDSLSGGAVVTGSIVYDYGQVELNASTASSPIETGGTAVTRAADVVSQDEVDKFINQDQGTFIIDISTDNVENYGTGFGLNLSNGNIDINVQEDRVNFRFGTANNVLTGDIARKIVGVFDRVSGEYFLVVNGGSASFETISNSSDFDRFEVRGASAVDGRAFYQKIMFLPYALTEAEASILTQPEE